MALYNIVLLTYSQCNEDYLIATMANDRDVNVEQVDGFETWLTSLTHDFHNLASAERLSVLRRLLEVLSPSELYEYSNFTSEFLHRDFISCLPAELVDRVLSFVDYKSLLRTCCVSVSFV